MGTPFDRLTPALQYQIVNELGWRSLRPVQEQTIPIVLDGKNCVVLAPTAGGKTEAALLPLLSLMDSEDRPPLSTLYVAPIRALLNDQEERLSRLASLVGRRAFKWHGDVGQSARRAFIDDPTDILATTPESLEVILVSERVPSRRLFRLLRAVVVDEVHAFAGDDRGAHLVALLERIARLSGGDPQRIGLSATVGNPEEICRWLSGSSERGRTIVDASQSRVEAKLSLDWVATLENAAIVIDRLHRGRKRLVFVDSRSRVESLGHDLMRRGVDTFVTHSSLSVHEREAAERAFAQGTNCVIVATSALELGIDVGDLDHVLQIDAPTTVASFLQRMGRTGRRETSTPNCTFLATGEDALLQAAGLLRLYQRGYVEPTILSSRTSHILAHQLMALSLQHRGVPVTTWWSWVEGAAPFDDLEAGDRDELVETMRQRDILVEADSRLILGEEGEKLYGRRHFMELYAVFSTPPLFKIMWGPHEIGDIDAAFVQLRHQEDMTFILGGRPWRVTHIDWQRAMCFVEPAEDADSAFWGGAPRFLSKELCQAIRSVLVDDELDPWWSRRARRYIEGLREEYRFLRESPAPFVEEPHRVLWWTFAGGKANLLLARILEERLATKVRANNLRLDIDDDNRLGRVEVEKAISGLCETDAFSSDRARDYALQCARGTLSKFEPCLSDRLLADMMAERLIDIEGAREAVRSVGEA